MYPESRSDCPCIQRWKGSSVIYLPSHEQLVSLAGYHVERLCGVSLCYWQNELFQQWQLAQPWWMTIDAAGLIPNCHGCSIHGLADSLWDGGSPDPGWWELASLWELTQHKELHISRPMPLAHPSLLQASLQKKKILLHCIFYLYSQWHGFIFNRGFLNFRVGPL